MKARGVALALLVLAVACVAFAWWGLSTVSGRKTFDEMAGIFPVLVGVAGLLCVACSGVIFLCLHLVRGRSHRP
ncbi:hypothetical protein [Dokdonella sp.]|uniref:hypothetical protein n=1 Tax=Dokdonella sp. TaxID=2291710 RepID=UPI003528CB12